MRDTALDLVLMMSGPIVVVAMVAGLFFYTQAGVQSARDRQAAGHLRDVFPDATSFSSKTGDPPHFRAFTTDPQTNNQALVGLAFYTTDLEPLEQGYDGPIKILVGMTIGGILTGIKVVEHHEPFGYFSIETREFRTQFEGKSILDRFRVARDIDAISRATISVSSAARAIRNSGRRIARQYLTEPERK